MCLERDCERDTLCYFDDSISPGDNQTRIPLSLFYFYFFFEAKVSIISYFFLRNSFSFEYFLVPFFFGIIHQTTTIRLYIQTPLKTKIVDIKSKKFTWIFVIFLNRRLSNYYLPLYYHIFFLIFYHNNKILLIYERYCQIVSFFLFFLNIFYFEKKIWQPNF